MATSVDAYKNFSYSTVLTAPVPATSGTALTVQVGDGTKFPTVPFNAVVWAASSQPTTANAEIVRVTAIATDVFTIQRTQESTSARTIVAGDQIICGFTADMVDNIRRDIQRGNSSYATDAGGVDNYEITRVPNYSVSSGTRVLFKTTGVANTGAATLNVNGVGGIPIYKGKSWVLDNDDIITGQIFELVYESTLDAYQLISTPNTLITDRGSNLFRNAVINGGFDIWQRNTTFTTPNDDTYIADCWNNLQESNAAWTFSRSTDVPSTLFNYSIKAVNVTANNQCGIVTLIENLNAKKIAGQTASLSFYAKTTTSKVISNLRATVLAWTGSADSLTSDVVGTWAQDGTDPTWATSYTSEIAGANKALTTSWQRFTIENFALDTASTNNYAVIIWVDDGTITATDEFYVTGVQLNVGSAAMVYSPLSVDDEFRKCQRYYQKSYEEGTFPAAATTTGIIEFDWGNTVTAPASIGAGSMLFPVQMRAVPTFTPYDAAGNSGVCTIYDAGAAGTNNTSINSYRASSKGLTLRVYNVAAHGVTFHYTLDASL